MIEPLQQRLLLARLEVAQSEARRHLRVIERQIAGRAERLTITDRAKRRQHGRGAHAGPAWRNRRPDAQTQVAGAGDRRAAIAPQQYGCAVMMLRPGGRHVDQALSAKAKR